MRIRPFRQALKATVLLLVVGAALSCSSRPQKYRKKRGCDCPKWNHRHAPAPNGVHANLPGRQVAPFGQPGPLGTEAC